MVDIKKHFRWMVTWGQQTRTSRERRLPLKCEVFGYTSLVALNTLTAYALTVADDVCLSSSEKKLKPVTLRRCLSLIKSKEDQNLYRYTVKKTKLVKFKY